MMGEKANIFKARCLHGVMDVDAADIIVEVSAQEPGEVSGFAIKPGGSEGHGEEDEEVSRNHNS